MEDQEKNNSSVENANQPSIYQNITIGLIVTLIGAYLRFAAESHMLSIASWIILFIGVILCCRAVFKILGS